MKGLIALALAASIALPAVAQAAAKSGSYSGTSSGKYVQVGQATEPTDKGKVTFSVKSNKVQNLKLRGQLFQCGPPAEIPVTVKAISLNSRGKGSASFKDPAIGTLKISITVSSKGTASGSVKAASGASLCNPDYPVKFSAKRK